MREFLVMVALAGIAAFLLGATVMHTLELWP